MRPRLGAHVSAAGGYYHAIEHASAMGAECIQIFGASPRVWASKQPSEADAERFRALAKKHNIGPVFLHAAYLVNLASPLASLRTKSVESLISHLSIARALDAEGLIFHLGSFGESERETGLKRTIEGMEKVLERVPGSTKLVMENSAGGGTKLGGNTSDFAFLIKHRPSKRVKVCLDTAHTLAAGFLEQYREELVKKFFDEWDKAVGMEEIVAVHANDSKAGPNSHVDRHENIGNGYVGLSGFKNLAKEKRLHHAAWMLEVPGEDDMGPDKKNLDILKSCFA